MSGPRRASSVIDDREVDAAEAASLRPSEPSNPIAETELAESGDDTAVASSPEWGARLTTMLAISAGGLLGANARYLLGLWATDRWGAIFPWGTLLINVSGSFVLGLYLTLVTERFTGKSTTRLFVATGFLGAYTTFSTFSYETLQMALRGDIAPALAYVATSIIAGLIAVIAGVVAAHAL